MDSRYAAAPGPAHQGPRVIGPPSPCASDCRQPVASREGRRRRCPPPCQAGQAEHVPSLALSTLSTHGAH
eukprot:15433820-Alexandrium_andersonii.AAC.1